MTYTVLGPAGAPSRPPYGSFAGKPPVGGGSKSYTQMFTVMGPAGAPMRPPFDVAAFAGKTPTTNHPNEWIIRARRRGRR